MDRNFVLMLTVMFTVLFIFAVGPLLGMRWITNRWYSQLRAVGGDSDAPTAECVEKVWRLSWKIMAIGMFVLGAMAPGTIWLLAYSIDRVAEQAAGKADPSTITWCQVMFWVCIVGFFPCSFALQFMALTKMMLHRLIASYRIWPKLFAVTTSEADRTTS